MKERGFQCQELDVASSHELGVKDDSQYFEGELMLYLVAHSRAEIALLVKMMYHHTNNNTFH